MIKEAIKKCLGILKDISDNETKGETVEEMVDYVHGKDTWGNMISQLDDTLRPRTHCKKVTLTTEYYEMKIRFLPGTNLAHVCVTHDGDKHCTNIRLIY